MSHSGLATGLLTCQNSYADDVASADRSSWFPAEAGERQKLQGELTPAEHLATAHVEQVPANFGGADPS